MMNGFAHEDAVEFTTDSLLPKRDLTLHSAIVNSQGRLEVIINNETLEFPSEFIIRWCQCNKCYNTSCLSHTNAIREIFKKEPRLQSVSISEEGVTCVSTDGHRGTYTTEWLYNRRMTPEGRRERAEAVYVQQPVAWVSPDKMQVQKATWAEVTQTESGMDRFGTHLIRDGIFVITSAPTDRCVNEELSELTGLKPLQNHYGFNWIVENLPSPTNHAYTTVDLDLHIDQSYLSHCPNIQLLHCMAQSPIGGENVMSDGIRAALVLKKRNPEYYRLLTTLNIESKDLVAHRGQQQFYMSYNAPTIVVDKNGEPRTIQLNHASQSSFFDGTIDEYEEYTKAVKALIDILYELSITVKSQPGDILVFDNQRVLHGRLKYDSRYARKLEGWYLDWDMIHSRLRVSRIKRAQGYK